MPAVMLDVLCLQTYIVYNISAAVIMSMLPWLQVQSGMEALSGMDREVLMASINNIQEGLKQAVAQRQQFLSKGAQGLQDWNMLV